MIAYKTDKCYEKLQKRQGEITRTLEHVQKERRTVEENRKWIDKAAYQSRCHLLDSLTNWYLEERLSYTKLSCVSAKGDTVSALVAASPLSRSVSKQPLKPRSARNVRNLGKLLSSALLRPPGLARALQQDKRCHQSFVRFLTPSIGRSAPEYLVYSKHRRRYFSSVPVPLCATPAVLELFVCQIVAST